MYCCCISPQQILKYGGRPGYPGPEWINSFQKRQKLSLKEATKLSAARYNATKNPFIVNHYYDILEKTGQNLGLDDRPDFIWNVDESGLSHEWKKCDVISAKIQKTLQLCKDLRLVAFTEA